MEELYLVAEFGCGARSFRWMMSFFLCPLAPLKLPPCTGVDFSYYYVYVFLNITSCFLCHMFFLSAQKDGEAREGTIVATRLLRGTPHPSEFASTGYP